MKLIRQDEVPEEDATSAPIFLDGKVSRQALVGADLSGYYDFTIVNFAAGARNKFHAHTCDQILYGTKGTGIVATEGEQVVVREGDTVLIPAGEKHWHGAAADTDFSHISLRTPDSTTEILE